MAGLLDFLTNQDTPVGPEGQAGGLLNPVWSLEQERAHRLGLAGEADQRVLASHGPRMAPSIDNNVEALQAQFAAQDGTGQASVQTNPFANAGDADANIPKGTDNLVVPPGFGDRDEAKELARQQIAATSANALQQGTGTAEDAILAAEAAPKEGIALEKPESVEQSTWDKLSGDFDMYTLGFTLLATSGNRQGLAANFGLALDASRKASMKKKTAAAAGVKSQADLENKQADTELKRAQTVKALADADQKPTMSDLTKSVTDSDRNNLRTAINAGQMTGTEFDPKNATHNQFINSTSIGLKEIQKGALDQLGVQLNDNDLAQITQMALQSPIVVGEGTFDMGQPNLSRKFVQQMATNAGTQQAYMGHLQTIANQYIKQIK